MNNNKKEELLKFVERVHLGWYIKHLTPKVLLGWIVGYVVLWLEQNLIAF